MRRYDQMCAFSCWKGILRLEVCSCSAWGAGL